MATFCDGCGKELGFFSAKKRAQVDGIKKTFCIRCVRRVPEPVVEKAGGDVAALRGEQESSVSLKERLERFLEEVPEQARWAQLVKAAIKDVLIYGVNEDNAREAMELVLSKLSRFDEDDKGTVLEAMARFSLEVLNDPGMAKKHARQTLLSAKDAEAEHGAYLVLVQVAKAQGDDSKAFSYIQKAMSLEVSPEAQAKAKRVKSTL